MPIFPSSKRLPRFRGLRLESLEPRLTMSWDGLPPSTVLIPPTMPNLAFTANPPIATKSAGIAAGEVDYFAFTAPRGGRYQVAVNTPASDMDSVLGIFDSQGQLVAFNDDATDTNTDSRTSSELVFGKKYYVGVTNYTGQPGGAYTLRVAAPADDRFEQNDSLAAARDLGTLSQLKEFASLQLQDGADWFRFHTIGTGQSADQVQILFGQSRGDLDLRLYDQNGTLQRASTSQTNVEHVSLAGLPAGDYYIAVTGYQGATNPNYSLKIFAPSGVTPSSRVLYMNFEGANITAANLAQWSQGQWDPSQLDDGNNGIQVNRFLNGQADRDAVIAGIIAHVQQDLRPFGISLQRHYGLAVTGVGATTLFFGDTPNDSLGHQASDVDFGNDDLTDIAFISEETWGSTAETILALSDCALHEAGHTYGLYHVNTLQDGVLYPESMGLRYSTTDTNQWIANTSFMNRTFAEFLDHGGGRGNQNSYQTLRQNFGLAIPPTASSLMTTDTSQPGVFAISGSGAADRIIAKQLTDGTTELNINGHLYSLGQAAHEVRIFTHGDARDVVTALGPLSISLVVDGSSEPTAEFGKVVASEAASWRAPSYSHHNEPSLPNHALWLAAPLDILEPKPCR